MFKPAKKKLKYSISTNSGASAKKVVDIQIKVGVAYNNALSSDEEAKPTLLKGNQIQLKLKLNLAY